VIITVVMTALATTFYASTKAITGSGYRMANTHDGQVAASWFLSDMQSSDTVDTSATDASCNGATPAALIRFTWIGWDQTPPIKKIAVYRVVTTGTERQLVRDYCEGPGVVALVNTIVIAHNLAPSGGASDPSVKCAATANGALAACPSTPTKEALAQLTATAQSMAADDIAANGTTYSYVIRAVRRET